MKNSNKKTPSMSPIVRKITARLRYFRPLQMAETVNIYCVPGNNLSKFTASLFPATKYDEKLLNKKIQLIAMRKMEMLTHLLDLNSSSIL